MWSAITPSSISIVTPRPHAELSSSRVLGSYSELTVASFPSGISAPPTSSLAIRMGGGPRTYPGGVSKWQWKRMQAKKAKQLLKARLCRERQIYEMRKRAELKAAVSELERPWEVVERAPTLFSVKADEQVKVLADRFQKSGGFDLWTDRDGPQVFPTMDGLPSARYFPKGVVHSLRPYGVEGTGSRDRIGLGGGGIRDARKNRRRNGGTDPRNSDSSCGGIGGSGEVGDDGDRTSSRDCSDRTQPRRKQNGRLKQGADSDSRLAGPRFGRKGNCSPNPRNLGFPSGRMIEDGEQNDDEGRSRSSFDSSKSSSLNLPADSNEMYFGASAGPRNRRRQPKSWVD